MRTPLSHTSFRTGHPGREHHEHDRLGAVAMTGENTAELVANLQQATGELQSMARMIESEIGSVTTAFEGLAGDTDAILKLAAGIVGRVENESVSSILPTVRTLGAAARHFMAERLQATTGVLEMVTTEVNLLRQLSGVAGSQEAIAMEIKALSVLTNIEVARLGSLGNSFQYLAHELGDFSKSVIDDTQELASHTNLRRAAIEDIRLVLSAELPRLREEWARIESDLGNALSIVDTSLTQLSRTPERFSMCVKDIAGEIAGVVAAIQAHDITRQQMEHVEQAFALICDSMGGNGDSGTSVAHELPHAHAGITIQVYQLRTIKETVATWASQIRTCMAGILRVSTSEVLGIGPLVLDRERDVSLQLARIERLEGEGRVYSERIERTLGGLCNLTQLVSEHVERSKSIRDRLRMLAFNSIIEASHLGTKANVILAISTSIKDISLAWSEITKQSSAAMQNLLDLVKQTKQVMEAFSEASNARLHEAQVETRVALDNLRSAAEFAAGQAREMKSATERMQTKSAKVGDTSDRLDACFGRFDAVLGTIEGASRHLETDLPDIQKRYDTGEMERVFSAFYTTELERDVLRAALRGKALPVAQQTFAGNSAELF